MDQNDLSLDDLHDDDNPNIANEPGAGVTPTPKDPPISDPEPADPTPATDPVPQVQADPAPTSPPATAEGDPAPSGDDPSPASGLELFLSEYDIEGGMITYDDGTSVHVSDLKPEEQAKILATVTADARPAVEDQYDLDEKEIGLLNQLRNSNKSVDDFIGDMAMERFQAYKTDIDSRSVDYNIMDADSVYVKFLREKNSEISDREIEEGLSLAKDNPTYSTLVEGLRDTFISKQTREVEKAASTEKSAFVKELEGDRQAIVDAASKITEIGNFEIPREVKNDVLHDLLEVNEMGDSLFLEKTFSNPETMFKTAWFSKYGEDYLSDVENYYKQEVTKSYKRGQQSIVDGLPGQPKSFSRAGDGTSAQSGAGSNSNNKQSPQGKHFDPDDYSDMDLDGLHNLE